MSDWTRLAVYALPDGPLGDFGAAWLGWDARSGRAAARPQAPGLDLPAITAAAMRYGFHATMVAPFRLRPGVGVAEAEAGLRRALADQPAFALRLAPERMEGGWLALTPAHAPPELAALEARLVEAAQPLRAPLTEADIARRRPETLDETERANLLAWGYPWVRDLFRFHITLTGPLGEGDLAQAEAALAPHLAPLLAAPLPMRGVALMGEAADGFFHRIAELPFGGITASSAASA